MFCSICGIEIESIDDAIDDGWLPSFYDGETEHEVCCPTCSETILTVGRTERWSLNRSTEGENRVSGHRKPGTTLCDGYCGPYGISE